MSEPHSDFSPCILETSDETFQEDVFERSRQQPVIVDFWATWCQPCRMLGPMLEQIVRDRQGEVVLVKAETERVQRTAMQFQVQAIPTVFGVVDGEVLDFFQGVLPQDQLRSWVDRLVARGKLAQALRLEPTSAAAAEQKYREVMAELPNEPEAAIGLARVLLEQGKADESRALIEQLENRGFLEADAEKVKAALELQEKEGGDIDACRAAVARDPDNLNLQMELAETLAGRQQYHEALEICLSIVQRDKKGVGEQARQIMVDIFRVMPDDSELVRDFRRKLSTALY